MNFLKKLIVSWKTTVAGLVIALNLIFDQLFLLVDSDALTNPSWEIVIAQLSIAVGLILSRDVDKSSQDTGIEQHKANDIPS